MMGIHQPQAALFSYRVNLEHRVRPDHPLRRAAQVLDLTFVRAEVARFYGQNGNEGVDPIILVKLMFLLFFDDVPSERELMARLPERLDYLWFLGYNLDEQTPNHSVLSKARRRWGREVFENIFLRTIQQCVEAGLVEGHKIHVDSSLVAANASKDSVVKSSPELIAAYKQAVAAQATKLEDTVTPESYVAANDAHVSTTDPDAAVVSRNNTGSRLCYHHHRAVDDAHGVITAIETTPGSIAENHKLFDLINQHEKNTEQKVTVVVADSKYGTADNLAGCVDKDIVPHLGVLADKQKTGTGYYEERHFTYDASTDTYTCPAGQELSRRRHHQRRGTDEYGADPGVCAACPMRQRCTDAASGRTLQRRPDAQRVAEGRSMARSAAAQRDRRRRWHLIEGSFGRAANEHGFKRSRWRRLWRQQIQDWLIAAVQNVKLLMRAGTKPLKSGAAVMIQLAQARFRPVGWLERQLGIARPQAMS
ncbi:MAG TPA: IS1182 family transposase [Blastocatellia bacterium]|nr:IS1182 family transposase [Blastocatellia bacterium]